MTSELVLFTRVSEANDETHTREKVFREERATDRERAREDEL